ncbi:sporulation histidine kinase inhibitor Sda [Niallia circulans]|uniref:Sporulation histidine kinase inhibitor Sda n=1 Tax=Niallia circulans TaxID=1397 RepID=A0A553SNA4_NIACI|nr:sporulation histidine kinase inhibitor Sda [Niallia circulans]TRZ38474.1 sporulation histidine kinase inhibitor Sda [Niallia circulans]
MSSLKLLSDKSLLFAYRHAQRLNLDMEFITMLKQEITKRKLIHIVFNKNTKILYNQHNKEDR